MERSAKFASSIIGEVTAFAVVAKKTPRKPRENSANTLTVSSTSIMPLRWSFEQWSVTAFTPPPSIFIRSSVRRA